MLKDQKCKDNERSQNPEMYNAFDSIEEQSLESIGRLAGGISHHFNNLLAVIFTYSELVAEAVKNNSEAKEDVREIQRTVKRAAELTRQLLVFSQKEVLRPKHVDLNDILMGTEKMLHQMIGENIQILPEYHPNLPKIYVDPKGVEQILFNLALNARDAMPNGGKLIVKTKQIELDKQYALHQVGVKPGRYVQLSVSDTGIGMQPEMTAKAFDPFFTTKDSENGTGLGLSMVYGIVKRMGGNIQIKSEPGIGTTLKINFPVSEDKDKNQKLKGSSLASKSGKPTILVAEDENSIRKMVHRILTKSGYNVLTAGHGKEALFIAQQQEEPIDLLLSDVMMPEMDGKELAQCFSQKYLNSKVLLMSGHAEFSAKQNNSLNQNIKLIRKPFTKNELIAYVKEALKASSSSNPAYSLQGN